MADQESVFTDQDMTLETYRAFSPLALTSFFVSLLLSSIAVINPVLVGLTIPAILLALVCIGLLFRNRHKMTGFKLAGLALAFPISAGAGVLSYQWIRFEFKQAEAIRHADEWLQLVEEGKTHEPFELMQLRYARQPVGTDLAAVYGDEHNPGPELEYYLRNQPERDLREDGGTGTWTHTNVYFQRDPLVPTADRFIVEYDYRRPSGESRVFALDMRRHLYGDKQVVWSVDRVINNVPREERFKYEEVEKPPAEGEDAGL